MENLLGDKFLLWIYMFVLFLGFNFSLTCSTSAGSSWRCVVSWEGVSPSNRKNISQTLYVIGFWRMHCMICFSVWWQHTYRQELQYYKIIKQNSTTSRSSLSSNRSSSPNSFNISAINENEVDWFYPQLYICYLIQLTRSIRTSIFIWMLGLSYVYGRWSFKIASCHCAVNENRQTLAEVHNTLPNFILDYDDIEWSRKFGSVTWYKIWRTI